MPRSAASSSRCCAIALAALVAAGASAAVLPRYTADGALLRPAGDRALDPGGRVAGTGLFRRYGGRPRDVPPGVSGAHRLRPLPARPAASATAPCWPCRSGSRQRRVPPSRAGWTEGELAAVEMAVKDHGAFRRRVGLLRFRPRRATTARALPSDRCQACHAAARGEGQRLPAVLSHAARPAAAERGVAHSLNLRNENRPRPHRDSCPPRFRGVCYHHPKTRLVSASIRLRSLRPRTRVNARYPHKRDAYAVAPCAARDMASSRGCVLARLAGGASCPGAGDDRRHPRHRHRFDRPATLRRDGDPAERRDQRRPRPHHQRARRLRGDAAPGRHLRRRPPGRSGFTGVAAVRRDAPAGRDGGRPLRAGAAGGAAAGDHRRGRSRRWT